MELKVWVEGIQRIVCGVSEKTTCQDVVYALAHATGKTGRFTLIERWRNNERLLSPQESPLKVLTKWGEYSNDVQFILQRSPLDNNKIPLSPQLQRSKNDERKPEGSSQPTSQVKKSQTFSGQLHHQTSAAIWNSPPSIKPKPLSTGNQVPKNTVPREPIRLSPDSGKGSDPTGSDTSNFSDQGHAHGFMGPGSSHSKIGGQPRPGSRFHSQSPDRGGESGYGSTKPRSKSNPPPAYRPPPNPTYPITYSSPSDPPPYRNPPPPPGSKNQPPTANSPTMRGQASPSPSRGVGLPPPHPSPKMARNMTLHSPTPIKSHQIVRPHYSPPPHHRDMRGHPRGPSPGRSHPKSSPMREHPYNLQQNPTRGHGGYGMHGSSSAIQQQQPNDLRPSINGEFSNKPSMQQDGTVPLPNNYSDLMNLVTVQQKRLQFQNQGIKQCDSELSYWDRGFNGSAGSSGGNSMPRGNVSQRPWSGGQSQLDAIVTEVKRLEEVAVRNDSELNQLNVISGSKTGDQESSEIRSELDQLKNRLELIDMELHKTDVTVMRLGDEMSSYTRQVESELKTEVERIEAEIKVLQKSSEEGANISEKLHKDVQDMENQISARKAEVEGLIQDMKSANLESLAISPPEENKFFLAGAGKSDATRKLLGSPRQLENAVPTSKNPNGVWV